MAKTFQDPILEGYEYLGNSPWFRLGTDGRGRIHAAADSAKGFPKRTGRKAGAVDDLGFFEAVAGFAERQYDGITANSMMGEDSIHDPLETYVILLLPPESKIRVQILSFCCDSAGARDAAARVVAEQSQRHGAVCGAMVDEAWHSTDPDAHARVPKAGQNHTCTMHSALVYALFSPRLAEPLNVARVAQTWPGSTFRCLGEPSPLPGPIAPGHAVYEALERLFPYAGASGGFREPRSDAAPGPQCAEGGAARAATGMAPSVRSLFEYFERHQHVRIPHFQAPLEASAGDRLAVTARAPADLRRLVGRCLQEGLAAVDVARAVLDHDQVLLANLLAGYALEILCTDHAVPHDLKSQKGLQVSVAHVVGHWGPDGFLDMLLDALPADELNYAAANGSTVLSLLADRRLGDGWYYPMVQQVSVCLGFAGDPQGLAIVFCKDHVCMCYDRRSGLPPWVRPGSRPNPTRPRDRKHQASRERKGNCTTALWAAIRCQRIQLILLHLHNLAFTEACATSAKHLNSVRTHSL